MKQTDKDKQKQFDEAQQESENARQQPASDEQKKAEGQAEEQVAEQQVEQVEETAEVLGERLKAAQDKYIRLLAEFDNYKRRTSREYERMVEAANEGLMKDLTEVRENFERALKAGNDNAAGEGFVQGMRLIFNKFDEVLGKNGLEPFGEEGDEFDPAIHDALMKTPHESVAEDHIAQVVERGYRLRGHVIKHARVLVSAGAPQQGESSGTPEQQRTEAE
ncbi:MAG: nucleotide exchange factor GrpE [Chitinivibrionales bacterium]|nr:nucleotide exchange factor GrpE [Chitinivibrionales bacterium]